MYHHQNVANYYNVQHSKRQSRRHKSNDDVVICTARQGNNGAKSECRRKNCRFAPCCFERNNKPMTHSEYAAMQGQRQSDAPRQNAGQRQQPVMIEKYIQIPIEPVYVPTARECTDEEKAIATKNGRLISEQLAKLCLPQSQNQGRQQNKSAVITTNRNTFAFTREQYNAFVSWFDFNAPSVTHLLESHIPFLNFVDDNYDEFSAMFDELKFVIAGKQKPQSAWLKTAFDKQLIDVDDIINNMQSYQSIIKLVAHGMFHVFKTFITNAAPNADTLYGLVVASYVCSVINTSGESVPVPTFEFVSSNDFNETF